MLDWMTEFDSDRVLFFDKVFCEWLIGDWNGQRGQTDCLKFSKQIFLPMRVGMTHIFFYYPFYESRGIQNTYVLYVWTKDILESWVLHLLILPYDGMHLTGSII